MEGRIELSVQDPAARLGTASVKRPGGGMKALKDWFLKTFPEEAKPRAERRKVSGLRAVHATGISPAIQDDVKDISASGMYLVTNERWTPGELRPIKLTCRNPASAAPDQQVMVQTKTVRWGKDGIGLSFVLPTFMELWLWKSEGFTEPEDILREFRIAEALAFLRRICPSATHQLKLLFREGLGNIRTESAVEIALRAETLLGLESDSEKLRIPKELLLRIVENGSWAEDDLSHRFWAGILATSCTQEGSDESNMHLVKIMSEFATIHSRLFDAACTRCTKILWEPGSISALPVVCSSEELIQIAGAHDLMKIDRNLLQLADLGLLEPREKSRFFVFTEDANLHPTSLGLEFYARCHGHRGEAHTFYQVTSPPPVSPEGAEAGA